jgi:hypothetical protein
VSFKVLTKIVVECGQQFCSPLASETNFEPQDWFCEPYNAFSWNEEPTHQKFAL